MELSIPPEAPCEKMSKIYNKKHKNKTNPKIFSIFLLCVAISMLAGRIESKDEKVKNKNFKVKNTNFKVDLTAAVMEGKIKKYFSLKMKLEKNEYNTKNFLSKMEYVRNVEKMSHFLYKRNSVKSEENTFYKLHEFEKFTEKSSYLSKENKK